jgi:hypothetical protein
MRQQIPSRKTIRDANGARRPEGGPDKEVGTQKARLCRPSYARASTSAEASAFAKATADKTADKTAGVPDDNERQKQGQDAPSAWLGTQRARSGCALTYYSRTE